ncbi:hypothetical protein LX36DRAFT_682870 [Colletotrichum falcatum]|nr:hypothetical protein LX36DRAFT_682870 [Colletotrichum falcatum]
MSSIVNKVDPRVDSDRDHRGAPGSGLTGTHGTTGSGLTGSHGTTTGTHSTHGNSSLTGNPSTGATGGVSNTHNAAGHVGSAVAGTHGTGPAPNTAGPHKSDAMNKADPRVDSDLDGSKTVGGNKTYAHDTTSGVAKDPTDASQVPPSVLAKHIGEPEIAHDDHGHGRARRNSKVSHQETHRGL